LKFVKNKIRLIFNFGLCCFLLLSQIAAAHLRFDIWTTDNGLPQNGVRAIAQTPDGFLWLTTFDGLVRYDGVKFAVFDKNNSRGIESNRFFLLHVEPDGTLFAGTEDGGLTVYQNGKFRTFTTADGLPSNRLVDFSIDANGNFYIRSSGGAVYFRDGKFEHVPLALIPNDGQFYRGANSGKIWTYNTDGIRQIKPDKKFYPLRFRLYNEKFTGLKFFEDKKGRLWFGDLNGVYYLQDDVIRKFTIADGVPPDTVLQPFVEDADGAIWFAVGLPWINGAGAARFLDGKFTIWNKSNGLSSDFVHEIFRDRENSIWLTTTNLGINRWRKQFIESFSVANGIVHAEVYPLLAARGGEEVYVGTIRGLSVFRAGKFSEVKVRNQKGEPFSVTALFEDKHGVLWIGTAGDLYVLANNRLQKVSPAQNLTYWTIAQDKTGDFWIGTNKGLFLISENFQTLRHFTTENGLSGDDVKIVYPARNGDLWIGTYGGVTQIANCKLQIADCPIKNFTTADGLASERVRTIFEDREGVLWIGTYDGGLSRLKNKRFFNFTIENGLYSNGVFQIFEDAAENFWISCNKGIFRVGKRELANVADGRAAKVNSIAYGKSDGMLNTECNGGRSPAGARTADGKLWFPTQDGVAVVNPSQILVNNLPPSVKIETALIERRAADLSQPLTMRADAENLEIRYTGISFIKPEQIRFRYRIEGLTENWTDVGAIREVFFPSLPAGDYEFNVIAANSDGVWNETAARLKIRVVAPFWRQTWFVMLAAITAMLLILGFARLRLRQVERRRLAQQEFSRRLIESQEQERKRIASELHDSLGQYLLAIKNWALFGLNTVEEKNPAREFLSEVSDTTAMALAEVREIAHNLRPSHLDRLGLTNALEFMLTSLEKNAPIQFTIELENIDGILSKESEIVFYRIVQETLSNVLKHSRAARARVSIKRLNQGLSFVCQDDGRGFDLEAVKQSPNGGLGLDGIGERLKILGGRCEIVSEINRGTIVSIVIEPN
jgi:signal transduction histidine kinase/ligand-binding sensor domain-containing protein